MRGGRLGGEICNHAVYHVIVSDDDVSSRVNLSQDSVLRNLHPLAMCITINTLTEGMLCSVTMAS